MYLGKYLGQYAHSYFGFDQSPIQTAGGGLAWYATGHRKKHKNSEIEEIIKEYTSVLKAVAQPIQEVIQSYETTDNAIIEEKTKIARNISNSALTDAQIILAVKQAEQEYLRNMFLLYESEDEAVLMLLLN